MKTVATSMTVVEYCNSMERKEIVVNRDYQRSSTVWPPVARSFLIETILLDFPMPKLSLYQITDLRSRQTYKEIVDGQQRSGTIRDFFNDKLRLSGSLETEDVRGKTYSELSDEYKQRFIDYQISIDLFVATTPDEVREVFRRINSYTVPLNPEEQRHAVYQGAFKWFVHRLSKLFDESFLRIGLFNQRRLVRMADAKLLTEIAHAFLNGIKTTNKGMLNAFYRVKDKEFPEEAALEQRITFAFDQILDWTEIHNGPIMKHYQVYSLVLAITHLVSPIEHLNGIYESPGLKMLDRDVAVMNLTALADAVESPEQSIGFDDFINASSSRTNVGEQRAKRFVTFCRALLGEI